MDLGFQISEEKKENKNAETEFFCHWIIFDKDSEFLKLNSKKQPDKNPTINWQILYNVEIQLVTEILFLVNFVGVSQNNENINER